MATRRIYQRRDGKWDWKLISSNGRQQAESMQGFRSERDAIRGFEETRRAFAEFDAEKFGKPEPE